MDYPEIQVMKIKFNWMIINCHSCRRLIENLECMLTKGSGEYTLKCQSCSDDLVYIEMEDGCLIKLRDSDYRDVTEVFKEQIEVIW